MKIIRKRQSSTCQKMRITLLINLLFTAYRSDFKNNLMSIIASNIITINIKLRMRLLFFLGS